MNVNDCCISLCSAAKVVVHLEEHVVKVQHVGNKRRLLLGGQALIRNGQLVVIGIRAYCLAHALAAVRLQSFLITPRSPELSPFLEMGKVARGAKIEAATKEGRARTTAATFSPAGSVRSMISTVGVKPPPLMRTSASKCGALVYRPGCSVYVAGVDNHFVLAAFVAHEAVGALVAQSVALERHDRLTFGVVFWYGPGPIPQHSLGVMVLPVARTLKTLRRTGWRGPQQNLAQQSDSSFTLKIGTGCP